jgi:hypothetical protein
MSRRCLSCSCCTSLCLVGFDYSLRFLHVVYRNFFSFLLANYCWQGMTEEFSYSSMAAGTQLFEEQKISYPLVAKGCCRDHMLLMHKNPG